MFVDFQRQPATDIDGHENISHNVTQISTPTGPSLPLQACSSVSQASQPQTHAQPQTSQPQQVQDPLVLHSDTQRPKVLKNISQSTCSSEQDSPKVETPCSSVVVNKYLSFPFSTNVEKDYVSTTPILIDHCDDCKLSQEEKELPVKEKNILKICYELKSWKKTAREGFGLTEAQVCQLENDYKTLGDKEYAFQSYLKWKMQNGYTDTYTITLCEMVEMLHRSQEHEAIKKLKCLVLEAEDTNLSVVES